MIEPLHPDNEPTPTIRELYERKDGTAEAVEFTKDMKPTIFRLTDKGFALLAGIARRNAAATLARGSAREETYTAVRRSKKKGEGNGRKGAFTPS